MSTNSNYDIVSGPNMDLLFDACKYACNSISRVTFSFIVAKGYTRPKNDPGCAYIPLPVKDFQLLGIEHEDGSEYKFNLHGNCRAALNSSSPKVTIWKPYRFKAYYDTKNRTGIIAFTE